MSFELFKQAFKNEKNFHSQSQKKKMQQPRQKTIFQRIQTFKFYSTIH